jgi:hypothetical protein
MANVIIDIAAEFTGKKGFKQAETATDKLGKGVKKLAGALGLAFGTAQVVAFGKASLKAFSEDEKAAARLTQAVENLGLGFEDARIKTFISDLEKTAGVSDDVLRPAFQSLLQTTGSVAKSQELLTLALDISAGSGIDAAEVSKDLSLAYLGQTKGLSKYNTGLTKAELNTASFSKIQATLNDQFAGQNAARLETYAGKMESLGVAAGNAKEIIGKGIVDALSMLGDDQSVTNLADNMTRAAESTADVIRGIGILAAKLKTIPGFDTTDWEYVYNISYLKFIKDLGAADRLKPKPFTTPMTVSGSTDADTKAAEARKKAEEEARKRALELLKIKNKQLDSEKKALAAKKLANAIDKANLALNKGQDIFDMDKIQIAAALTNQAEQLGKATSGAQLLQIANDTARLNVKKSILALEDAIASKDEAAIIAATAKLNEDLKILGALTNQKTQMVAIESILKGLTPKDLINQNNLDEALRKIKEMLALLAQVKTPTITPPAGNGGGGGGFIQTPNGIRPTTEARSIAEINKANEELGGVISVIGANGKEFIKLVDGLAPVFQSIEDSGAFNALVNSFAGGTIGSFDAGSFRAAEGGSLFNSGAVGSRDRNISITVNTGVGDPEAIARAIEDAIRQANQRGTTSLSIG